VAGNIDLTELGPLALADFGTAATFSPQAGGSFRINGVYDNAYRELELSADAPPVNTVAPALGVNLADFPSPPLQGDALTILEGPYAGTVYAVREVRPDSHGWAILMLNRTSGT